jgi:hypothetical protein
MGEKTVDFFVVTDTVIVLVEAKAVRPIEATRLGEPASDEDIDRKVGGVSPVMWKMPNATSGRPSHSMI